MSKTEYYFEMKYNVLENKSTIFIFKKTIFGNLKFWKALSKDCYIWEEDETEKGTMFIIKVKEKENEI